MRQTTADGGKGWLRRTNSVTEKRAGRSRDFDGLLKRVWGSFKKNLKSVFFCNTLLLSDQQANPH